MKVELLFENLPQLLRDMKKKDWIIDSFHFKYKDEKYIVILTLYGENDKKPSPYAKANVEFVKWKNTTESINGYIDFYNVRFKSAAEFCSFFNINIGNAKRELFKDFAQIFATFIPGKKIIHKDTEIERNLIVSRVDPNNPLAKYCYDIRRNGRKLDGTPNTRSIANSNKAQTLRPKLYKKYAKDKNLSFFFSESKEDEKTDIEIIRSFSARKENTYKKGNNNGV